MADLSTWAILMVVAFFVLLMIGIPFLVKRLPAAVRARASSSHRSRRAWE